jgi:hypothetical protein
MSDTPVGPGWWQASDGKWYAPELHPDRLAGPPPPSPPPAGPASPPGGVSAGSLSELDPPPVDQWVSDAPVPPGGPPPLRYPEVADGSRRWSGGRILALVLGGLFLLLAGGCGALAWVFREEIADATVDFSDGVAVDEPASCVVTGVDLANDYEIEATLTPVETTVVSHFRLDLELTAGDRTVGRAEAVLRSVAPGEARTESVFNTIAASEPIGEVVCSVVEVVRDDA